MEKKEIEGRIRQLECLLNNAKDDGKLGMVVYYRMMLDELVDVFDRLNDIVAIG
ncbi:hypothetical protein MSP8886_01403 [Marinomonas spartinae]|uniref:Uncharacterized protein n=1 Tax=Marinomonas spartinae TaxID=1792290 RepID=A0A1A8T997_9GAMM|nr:hypothetical protein [Marinomonas spartinae]SBS29018.1 hypothetical protein MSP8886_01403 [Marinomonas spartinae]